MEKKRNQSRTICVLLSIVMLIGIVRMTTYQTLVNEKWHVNEHLKYKIFNKIYSFIDEELADLSVMHFIPVDVLDELVSVEDVKMISRRQTKALLAYNRGEVDTFPVFNVDDVMRKFDERMEEFMDKYPNATYNLKLSLRYKTEKLLFKNLSIINYSEFQQYPAIKVLTLIMNFFNLKYFALSCTVIILSLIGCLFWIWRHKMIEWIYYVSVSVLSSGGILFGVFLYFHHIDYYEKNKSIAMLRTQLYQLNFNEFYKCLYTIGMYLMMGGFIVCLLSTLMKEIKRISSGAYFEDVKYHSI